MNSRVLLITCEHAGNQVPFTFSYLFRSAGQDLDSHRGWDPGALVITRAIAEAFNLPYHYYDYTRLLIEPNRSQEHPQLFSEYSSTLKKSVKKYLIDTYYEPYRSNIIRAISSQVDGQRQVLHLSVHTFTPIWEGKKRQVDIGLLLDESRGLELSFCLKWKEELEKSVPTYQIEINEPYNGADDGFTTYLRGRFPADQYLGIELEVSQKYKGQDLKNVADLLVQSLISLV